MILSYAVMMIVIGSLLKLIGLIIKCVFLWGAKDNVPLFIYNRLLCFITRMLRQHSQKIFNEIISS